MTRAITIAGYAALMAMMLACEVVARRTGRVATFVPALSTLARWRPTRLLLLAGWLWVGWHVFARVHR
jgi:hypothetical protein